MLNSIAESGAPEFIAVYGRRRVGKTFLIRGYFNERFSFYASGLNNRPKREQLKNFNSKLMEYGHREKKIPQKLGSLVLFLVEEVRDLVLLVGDEVRIRL